MQFSLSLSLSLLASLSASSECASRVAGDGGCGRLLTTVTSRVVTGNGPSARVPPQVRSLRLWASGHRIENCSGRRGSRRDPCRSVHTYILTYSYLDAVGGPQSTVSSDHHPRRLGISGLFAPGAEDGGKFWHDTRPLALAGAAFGSAR